MIDQRIVDLGISINNAVTWYRDLYITAIGNKLSVPGAGECEITLLNPAKKTRELILRETNPLVSGASSNISVSLMVGRESEGTSQLFQGTVFRTQGLPRPNLGLIMKCFGNNTRTAQGKYVSRTGGDYTSLSTIAGWVAADAGYSLNFQIPDKKIASYSFSGNAQKQIEGLASLSGARVYVESGILHVVPSSGKVESYVRKLSASSGLMTAERTEIGVRAQFLFIPGVNIGSRFEIESTSNPSLNGVYSVLRLDYAISNRDTPFYYVAEMNRVG